MASDSCGCGSRRLVVFVVFVALLLDNILLTVIVPIIPTILYSIEHPKNSSTETQASLSSGHSSSSSGSSPSSLGPLFNTSRSPSPHLQLHCESQISAKLCLLIRCRVDGSFMKQENFKVGALLASKVVVQLLVNPIVGPLTNREREREREREGKVREGRRKREKERERKKEREGRVRERIGFNIPMFVGFLIMFASTLMFAFAQTYALLVVARALQGVGSSFSSVAGLGMLATIYKDEERGQAMGMALGGVSLGQLCGSPFGAVMYQFVGKSSPFLVLAGLALLDGVLQLCVLKPTKVLPEAVKGTPLLTLLRDPYILLAAGSLSICEWNFATLEATLPIWMTQTMCSPVWQQGVVYVPGGILFLITANVVGKLSTRIRGWLCAMIGIILLAVDVLCFQLAKSFYALLGPVSALGLCLALVEVPIFLILAHLVEIRHVSVYGSVYAIGDTGLCLGFVVGPLLGGGLVPVVGFRLVLVIIAVVTFVYAPLLFFLRNPPSRDENKSPQNKGVGSFRAARLADSSVRQPLPAV
ncbi:hypothetical protein WMY93_020425 [Mugilogobius chulae]|uniref:Major facilitator superfamily (MFS) profile domain-containing protein n=1 Tax=Mugilogobius chulae TaxID=88201 RepID=A0AAW0NLZ2_9GOBI